MYVCVALTSSCLTFPILYRAKFFPSVILGGRAWKLPSHLKSATFDIFLTIFVELYFVKTALNTVHCHILFDESLISCITAGGNYWYVTAIKWNTGLNGNASGMCNMFDCVVSWVLTYGWREMECKSICKILKFFYYISHTIKIFLQNYVRIEKRKREEKRML
jgi:hypothetical protein